MYQRSSKTVVKMLLSLCAGLLALSASPAALAQQSTDAPSLPPSVEPFAALNKEAVAGNSRKLRFKRTELDSRVKATAQVVQRGQTLLVRVRAEGLPQPAVYNQQHYVLWVDVPNYGYKLFMGDLPLTLSRRAARRQTGRGTSDTAYYFPRLPEGAVFGGLMLTAEPKRYVPVPSEPLKLLLVALPTKKDADKLASAPSGTSTAANEKAPKQSGVTPQQPR